MFFDRFRPFVFITKAEDDFCVWKLLVEDFPERVVRNIDGRFVSVGIVWAKELLENLVWLVTVGELLPVLPMPVNCLGRVADFVTELLEHRRHAFRSSFAVACMNHLKAAFTHFFSFLSRFTSKLE